MAAKVEVHAMATNFSKQVDAYEQARPGYPQQLLDDVVAKLALKRGDRVLDLAAGNGKLTRMLVPFGFDLVAVEPAPGMREGFSKILPNVPILDGAATSIPFPDSSFDAVFVAQAFHWFSNRAALLEMRRVLKPNGPLILIWNLELRELPWMDKLVAMHAAYESGAPQYRHGTWRKAFTEDAATLPFEPLSELHYSNPQHVTRDLIWLRMLSISYISKLSHKEQEDLKRRVYAHLEEAVPEFVANKDPNATVAYPYATDVYWARTK